MAVCWLSWPTFALYDRHSESTRLAEIKCLFGLLTDSRRDYRQVAMRTWLAVLEPPPATGRFQVWSG
jgi:hypothetical protein